ncbi:hypothetical protein N825_22125 [Skermanella stibiiresistens SB22]|uniref:Mucin n=1 Tax=Skermanella stibiiresistens SB22 TaxID=1385369 RepID=W9GTA0_9PROT|nr:hypothetical protein [Skermanella stibiiresistens]EWY37009.1 hypothetical protein N825_22125 [Skermanella stibiiresistens SB22]
MRKILLAAAASLIVASPAAFAQAPANPANDPGDKPLMTAPQPRDQTTTDQLAPTPGISGEAPSRELTGQGEAGMPGATPRASDAPADMTAPGEAQNDRANPPPSAGTPPRQQ